MERCSKLFMNLLSKYKGKQNYSKRKNNFFSYRLMYNAKNFAEWAKIYELGDSSIRKDALRKMEELVICKSSREETKMNILAIFLVIDDADKDSIMRNYLMEFHEEEDFLFAIDETNVNHYGFIDFIYEEAERSGFHIDVMHGEMERRRRNAVLLRQSGFDPKSW